MRLRTLGVLLALIGLAMPVAAQESRGSIEGIVKDNTGAVLPGATVEATSPALIGARTTVSDSNGVYRFASLPPGDYTVSASLSGFSTAKSPTISLSAGQNLKAELALTVGGVSEQVQVSADAAVLDLGSSQTATTISAKTIELLPRGRTFNTLLDMAPGVRNETRSGTAGVAGYQIDGASTSENVFVVDGVDVSNVRNAALGVTDAIPFEFLQEVQIKNGGFEAQYGGALGGVVNVVSKSGTDQFHGEGMYQFTGSALNSGTAFVPSGTVTNQTGPQGAYRNNPDDLSQLEFFAPPEDDYKRQSYGFTIGGPIIHNRLRFFAGYIPEVENRDRSINFRSVGLKDSSMKTLQHRAIGRLDYAPTQKIQVTGSYFWNPSKTTGLLTTNDAKVTPPTTDFSKQGGYTPSNATNLAFNFIPSPKFLVSARYGYKYLNGKGLTYGKDDAPYYVYRSPSANAFQPVPAAYAGVTGFSNVASTFITEYDKLTRHNVYLDATYFATIGGQNHTIKGGYALNRLGDDVRSDYPQGYFQVYWGQTFTRAPLVNNVAGTYGYYTWEDGVRLNSAVNSRNQGFYVQDAWQVNSRLTVNLGVRVENEFLPPFRSEQDGQKIADPISFGWGDKIAPRFGAAYDVRGDGRWKLSASFVRVNDTLKYELARGSFGGDFWVTHVYRLDNPNVTLLNKATPNAGGAQILDYDNRRVDVDANGHIQGIDPAIKPMATDSFDVASDYLFGSSTTLTVRYTHKKLLRAIEDIGILDPVTGDEVYTIGNPGFGETTDSVKTALGASLVPKAQRDYDAVEARLSGRSSKLFYNVSYTWSRLYGNWNGLANADEAGRSDPNVSRAFDLSPGNFDGTGHNIYGLLANDRPHTVKLFGNYMLDSKLGTTSIGAQELIYSGTPLSSQASVIVPLYFRGRGDLGRTDVFSTTNLLLSHAIRLNGGSQKLVFEAYFDNLFDQKAEVNKTTTINRTNNFSAYVDDLYAGTLPDLFSLLGPTNATFLAANPSYNQTTQFQDGRQIRLGVRFQF